MPRYEINVHRDNGGFALSKDKNLDYLVDMSLAIYNQLMSALDKYEGVVLQLSPKFVELIQKLTDKADTTVLTEEEMKLFSSWVDCLCLIMLDMDSVNFKSREIKKYLKLSESLLEKSKMAC